jgi:hypothetical protein
VSNELVAEIRRLLGLPAADDDDAQDAATESEHDPGQVAPLNGQRLLDGAAGALGAPKGSVTINAAGGSHQARRYGCRPAPPTHQRNKR